MASGKFSISNSMKLIILLALSLLMISCETVSYYTQAARGQLAIVFGREDIERLLSDEDLSAELQQKFRLVLEIREFAANELALPVGDNYLSYVDVDREHVVWNVFAAPEFSTDPMNWCYPIAGCVAYKGYFSEAGALRYAQQLEDDGYDVYTGGIDAYSTLGWFDDSLLSTVITRADYQLAALIFHELAHQVAYLPGDTTFNESFATSVEREGLRLWLASRNQLENIDVAEENRLRQDQFVALVIKYRDSLDDLYSSDIDGELMRERKQVTQSQLREEYQLIKQEWDGYTGYDGWFDRSLNNAQLSTVSSYNDLLPFFDEILIANDIESFYQRVQDIIEMDPEERDRLIKPEN